MIVLALEEYLEIIHYHHQKSRGKSTNTEKEEEKKKERKDETRRQKALTRKWYYQMTEIMIGAEHHRGTDSRRKQVPNSENSSLVHGGHPKENPKKGKKLP